MRPFLAIHEERKTPPAYNEDDRGRQKPWYHLNLPSLFKTREDLTGHIGMPLFCNGNDRRSLLCHRAVRCAASGRYSVFCLHRLTPTAGSLAGGHRDTPLKNVLISDHCIVPYSITQGQPFVKGGVVNFFGRFILPHSIGSIWYLVVILMKYFFKKCATISSRYA